MTDTNTLLQSAARCRRMAERCANEAIAKKFEALANDYEEHARRAGRSRVIIDLSGPDGANKDSVKTQATPDASRAIEPSTSAA
jgi:hypothetical protein